MSEHLTLSDSGQPLNAYGDKEVVRIGPHSFDPHPPESPRVWLQILAGEAFGMCRDADAQEIRAMVVEHSDKTIAEQESRARDIAELWRDVAEAMRWMRETLPVEEEKAAA